MSMRQKKTEKKPVTTIQLPELIIKEEPIYEDEEYLDYTDQIHEPETKDEMQVPENIDKVSFPAQKPPLKIISRTDAQKITEISNKKLHKYQLQPHQSTSNLQISKVQSILQKPFTVNNQKY